MKQILIFKIKIEFMFFLLYRIEDIFNNLSQVLAKQPPPEAFPTPSVVPPPLAAVRKKNLVPTATQMVLKTSAGP